LGSQISIDHDVLTRHAAVLDDIADAVAEAVSAANTTTGFDGIAAFGLLCSPLGGIMASVTGAVAGGIDASNTVIGNTATALREIGQDFDFYEQQVCLATSTLAEELEG
jgi:hypothetical protein